MSSIGTSIAELLDYDDSSVREIKYFQRKCTLFHCHHRHCILLDERLTISRMLVFGYYDLKKNFKVRDMFLFVFFFHYVSFFISEVEKLRLLTIVSGYYDLKRNFKVRDMLLLHFLFVIILL